MEGKELEHLLGEVNALVEEHEKIAEENGEHFNIFGILELRNDEQAHSLFLRMLLDPKGPHGFKTLFLERFIRMALGNKGAEIPVSENFRVRKEVSFDNGRIDILICSDTFGMAIENKIRAADQPRQIERYYDYLQKEFPGGNFFIVYLTPDGHKPGGESLGSISPDDEHLVVLSYGSDVLHWLEGCREDISKATGANENRRAFVDGILRQYINLVMSLTGQGGNQKMTRELVGLLRSNPQNVKAAIDIAAALPSLKEALIEENVLAPLKAWAQANSLEFMSNDFSQSYFGFDFWRSEWKNIFIRFEFSNGDFINGFWYSKTAAKEQRQVLKERLSVNGDKDSGNAIYSFCGDADGLSIRNWNAEVFAEIAKPDNKVVKAIEARVEVLLKRLDEKAQGLAL